MSTPEQAENLAVCLIVEDSFVDQEMMRRILMRSFNNVHVEVASTLGEARVKLQKFKTALILLDNNLPDGKGANFAVEIAENGRFANVPVIIVSDWPSPFMFDKAQIAGVSQVVSKSDFGARHIHAAFAEKVQKNRATLSNGVAQARIA